MINRWFLGLARASIGNYRILCFLVNSGLPGMLLTFRTENRGFRETKGHPAEEVRARQPDGQESVVKGTAGDTTGRDR